MVEEILQQKFRKYRKIYRIKTKDSPPRKKILTKEEVDALLDGTVVIEEKMDGGTCGISKNGYSPHIQGRRREVPLGENSKPFYGIHSWAAQNYLKIMRIPNNWIVYGEWLRVRHQIPYDNLDDFFYAFDVWDGKKYLDIHTRSEFLNDIGFVEAPLIYAGNGLKVEDIYAIINLPMYNKSKLSTTELIEGVVIKNYSKGLAGKCIRKEFIEKILKHWLKEPMIENRLSSYGLRKANKIKKEE